MRSHSPGRPESALCPEWLTPGDGFRSALRLIAAVLLAPLILAQPGGDAEAVIIATGDGTGNVSAPSDDPGWANVGTRGGLSAVYLGNRWVLTASHVGAGDVVFGGTTYPAVASSSVRMSNADQTLADLIVFKVQADPGLPAPAIASSTPSLNKSVTMIGHGRNRGVATSWTGLNGWEWGPGAAMRWGTNRVSDRSILLSIGTAETQAFATTFDYVANPGAGEHEAQAANGDSGGAVFAKSGSTWQLAGTLVAIGTFLDQPLQTALYGNLTYAADLASYRDQILAVIEQPACSDGLDDDGDGLIDYPADPGCSDALDASEKTPDIGCDDGVDNDGDGAIDYPTDLQCESPFDLWETALPPALPLLGAWPGVWLAGLLLALGARGASRRAGRHPEHAVQ